MMRGKVHRREARIAIQVRGRAGTERQVDAVVDTGYTAHLTLPSDVIRSLDLRWHSVGRGILGDGSECLFDVFEATVTWDGTARRILVDEAETDPLVGMGLLKGFVLRLEAVEGGDVLIEPIP
jgi:clan AA aspartic protease